MVAAVLSERLSWLAVSPSLDKLSGLHTILQVLETKISELQKANFSRDGVLNLLKCLANRVDFFDRRSDGTFLRKSDSPQMEIVLLAIRMSTLVLQKLEAK